MILGLQRECFNIEKCVLGECYIFFNFYQKHLITFSLFYYNDAVAWFPEVSITSAIIFCVCDYNPNKFWNLS